MKVRSMMLILISFVFSIFYAGAQSPMPKGFKQRAGDTNGLAFPKTALLSADSLLQAGLKNNNGPVIVEAVLKKSQSLLSISPDSIVPLIGEIDSIACASDNKVMQSMLYSILAELYSKRIDRWYNSISSRSTGGNDEELIKRIIDFIEKSLEPAALLQQTDISLYKAALVEGDASRELRPTMYDFLAHRALELYQIPIYRIEEYVDQKQIKENLLCSVSDFMKIRFDSSPYQIMPSMFRIYQDLLDFRKGEPQSSPFLIDDLGRVMLANRYMNDFCYNDSLESQYINTLFGMLDTYKENVYSAEIANVLYINIYNLNKYEYSKSLYDYCEGALNRFSGDSNPVKTFKELRKALSMPAMWVQESLNSVWYPKEKKTFKYNYRNVKDLHVSVKRIEASPVSYYKVGYNREDSFPTKTVYEKTIHLNDTLTFVKKQMDVEIPGLENGYYVIELLPDTVHQRMQKYHVNVSSLLTQTLSASPDRCQIIVTDGLTGKPKEKVKIDLYSNMYNFSEARNLKTVYTDKNGIAEISKENDVRAYLVKDGSNEYYPLSDVLFQYNYERNVKYPYWVELWSDRGVYRPGQTVRFWGVAYQPESRVLDYKAQVVPNQKVTLTLQDGQFQNVETKEVMSDEFGSFSGEFRLPSNTSGSFRISSLYNGAAHFQVAEYKRPTFQIKFDPVKSTYSFGTPITITGNVLTYSGVSMPDVKVKYSINRKTYSLRRYDSRPGNQMEQGEVTTDSKGNFTLRFTPQKGNDKKSAYPVSAYQYEISVTVTSDADETQNAFTSLVVGEMPLELDIYQKRFAFNIPLPVYINHTDTSFVVFGATNLMNEPQKIPCKVTLYSLIDNRNLADNEPLDSLKVGKEVYTRTITSGDSLPISQWKDLPSAPYRLVLETEGTVSVKKEASFVLYRDGDKRPPVNELFYLPQAYYNCDNGKTVEVLFGSAENDLYVLAELYDNQEQLSCEWIKLNRQNYKYKVTYKESYGNVLMLNLCYVRNGKAYNKRVEIGRRNVPTKRLNIKTVTFRDHLLPGADEKWTFMVTDDMGKPVLARFAADMYDASLNVLQKNSWYVFFNKYENRNYLLWSAGNHQFWGYGEPGRESLDVAALQYDKFENLRYGGNVRGGGLQEVTVVAFGKQKKSSVVGNAMPLKNADIAESRVADAAFAGKMDDAVAAGMQTDFRSNFDETAFFYPDLQTDSTGQVSFTFRIPESNTLWQFQALAYTKDLQDGRIERNVTTSKPLMVSPNIPRFVRQGDEVTIPVAVINNSDEADKGTVLFELYDPYKDSVLVSENRQFSLDAHGTVPQDFRFKVSEKFSILGIRILAKGGKHTDGEQHLIPVLPSRSMVTETLPFGLKDKGEKTVTMTALKKNNSKTLENYRLTLEYTVNPTWYVVQALPFIMPTDADNTLSLITSYYANTLSEGIVKNNPRIETAIKLWKAKGKGSLVSGLLKNEQLKSILISETPWVLEASNMTDRMQQLENLFDENRIAQEQRTALSKLQALQTPSGAWSWFNGMYPSASVTLQVLEYMSRLTSLGFVEYGSDVKSMQMKALSYLDNEILNPRKEPRAYMPSYDVNYLYVRSAYRDVPLAGETLVRHKAMMDSLLKYWPDLWLGGKAKAAIAAYRYGFVKEAKQMIESLRQYATTTQQMGMFWDTSHSSMVNPEGAIRTQTLIAQAFAEVEPQSPEINEIKRWLLMQKQAQDWGNTAATADAVYTLLNNGNDWLTVDDNAVKLLWGGEPVEQPSDDPFSGYIQQSKNATEIVPADATVKVSSSVAHPSWGALYWQYFEDFNKVKQSGSGLKMSKQIFIQKMIDGKMKWLSLNETSVTPGDKVRVRLVITADRDMDFVYLKNQRAACLEPTEQLSGYKYKGGIGYYQENNDAVTNFYFDFMPKGTYEIEYDLWADRPGIYHNGISTVQCLYAPQYTAQTPGETIVVK